MNNCGSHQRLQCLVIENFVLDSLPLLETYMLSQFPDRNAADIVESSMQKACEAT
jgi:hypothetical protein